MSNIHTAPLVVGQVVETVRNGRAVVVKIHGVQRPQSVERLAGGAVVTGGNASFDIIYFSGVRSIMVPESIICSGLPWTVLDIVVGQEEIDRLEKLVEERKEKEAREKAEAAATFAIEKARLQENPEYSHLKKLEQNKGRVATFTAGNIRADLKKNYPGVKFGVTTSDGDSVRIKWTDGPTDEEVKNLTLKYKNSSFDAYEDYTTYHTSSFHSVFGGVSYVFTDHSHSDAAVQLAIDAARKKFGEEVVPAICTVELFKNGGFYPISRDYFHFGLEKEVRDILEKRER